MRNQIIILSSLVLLIYFLYSANQELKDEVLGLEKARVAIIEGYNEALVIQKELVTLDVASKVRKEILEDKQKELNKQIKENNEKTNIKPDTCVTTYL